MRVNKFLLGAVLEEKQNRLFEPKLLRQSNPVLQVRSVEPPKKLSLYSWCLYVRHCCAELDK